MAKRTTNTQPRATLPQAAAQAPGHLAATKKAFSDPIAVAAILTLCATFGAFTYQWGKDVGQGELKMRQDLATMNLPQIAEDTRASTADLKTASAAFKEMLVNNATYQDMLAKHDAQIKQISDLTSEVTKFTEREKSQQEKISNLESRLAVHENPERVYDIQKGTSQQAAGGEIVVGMQYYMSGFAEITINGKRESAQAGTMFDVDGLKGGKCRVRFVTVSFDDKASFSAECSK
ncbi:hypothetical protein CFBP5875_04620 [Agrobacterium pusense]|uniref:hypothetical protein n=1 Tax=Agrobacterium pusense TaxID=648995 RepID=UPI0010BED6BF|nr:hypothetical protein [Agrobacterium pusense]QCL83902.1 hypothetical protein CFBP5875_04620 [Agrobacterium pusense]